MVILATGELMQDWFAVENLDVERLLVEWRWLCQKPMALVARNAFADLFLRDASGQVYCLDVAVGALSKVADSEGQFRELATTPEKEEEWFAAADEKAALAKGLAPDTTQCIGFSVPLVFAESGSPDTPYVCFACTNVVVRPGIETNRSQKLPERAAGCALVVAAEAVTLLSLPLSKRVIAC